MKTLELSLIPGLLLLMEEGGNAPQGLAGLAWRGLGWKRLSRLKLGSW